MNELNSHETLHSIKYELEYITEKLSKAVEQILLPSNKFYFYQKRTESQSLHSTERDRVTKKLFQLK